jgi:hypothetical protein
MMQAISIYMVAALVLPDAPANAFIDLKEHYFAHRTWFFTALIATTLFSVAKDLALYGRLPGPLDLGFHLIFGVAAILAAITRREWFHKPLAPAVGFLFLAYIGLLFTRL